MRRVLVIIVVLVAAGSTWAQPVLPAAAAEMEPLPESAFRRLGTTRFRPGVQQTLLSFSANGRLLASAGYDGRLRVWDVSNGREISSFSFQYNQVSTVRFSPDSAFLAAGAYDGIVRVWSTADWTEHTPPPPPQRNFDPPFFDWLPDSKTLVRLGRDGKLRIQQAISGKELQNWHVGPQNVTTLACRPDGKLVVTQSHEHLLRAWDLTTGQEVKTFEVPANNARVYRSYPRLHFSRDGKVLAATENERTVLVWNTETGKIARRLEVSGYFQSMALAPNGRVIATSAGDSSIRLWGVMSGRELRVFDTPRESSTALLFSPDGKRLVSSGVAALRFWDLDNDRELYADRGHRAPVQGVAFLAGGQQLVSMANDTSLRLWDCALGSELDRHSAPQYYYGSSLVAADGGRAVLFPAGTQGLQRWLSTAGRLQFVSQAAIGGSAPGLSPDGQTAVSVLAASYRIYDVATGRVLRTIEAPERQTNIYALSTGGRYFAAAHGYRDQFSAAQVSVYDIATGRRWRPLTPPQAQPMPAQRLVFSPDTRFLAVAYSNGETRVWELATGLARLVIPAEKSSPTEPTRSNISSAVFTPDSRALILGSGTGQVSVCELDHGTPLHVNAHRAAVATIACSTAGDRLATGSADTSILLWDLRDLRRRAPQRPMSAVAPAPDELEHAWNMLGTSDEKAVGAALTLLSTSPKQTVPLFRIKLQPVQGATADEIRQWVKQLGEARYATREKATRLLSLAGENARPMLVQALAGPPDHAEARRRLEQLLQQLNDGLTAPKLQPLRAVEVLERIGTPEARALLAQLGGKTTDVIVKEEIERTLQRLPN